VQHRPRTVRVTLTRSGEQKEDVQVLRQVHDMLLDFSGEDQFVISVVGGPAKPIELTFPNLTTRYCPELARRLTAVVGEGAVRVEEGML
jgi:hypothetical protein